MGRGGEEEGVQGAGGGGATFSLALACDPLPLSNMEAAGGAVKDSADGDGAPLIHAHAHALAPSHAPPNRARAHTRAHAHAPTTHARAHDHAHARAPTHALAHARAPTHARAHAHALPNSTDKKTTAPRCVCCVSLHACCVSLHACCVSLHVCCKSIACIYVAWCVWLWGVGWSIKTCARAQATSVLASSDLSNSHLSLAYIREYMASVVA